MMNAISDELHAVYARVSLPLSSEESAWRETLQNAQARGFGGVVLPLKLDDERAQLATKRALTLCRELQLSAQLRIEYSIGEKTNVANIQNANPTSTNANVADENADVANVQKAKARSVLSEVSGAPYICYETRDVNAGESPLGESANENAPFSLAIVPRDAFGALDWARAQNRTSHDAAAQAVGFASRVFAWRERNDATRDFDPLHRSDVERVLSSTRFAWKNAVTDDLRATVRGVSVSVPTLWDELAPDSTRRFPWSLELPIRFQALHGYDIVENLASLVADTGNGAVRVRREFWQTVAALMRENFAVLWNDWAQENDVRLQWRFQATNLNRLVARYSAITTFAQGDADIAVEIEENIDSGDNAQNSSNTVLVRLMSSLAVLNGENGDEKPRRVTVCFPNVPPLFAWHRYLLAGATRFEVGLQNDDSVARSQLLNDYIARQTQLLRSGKLGARVGVLWPKGSAWAHHHPKGHKFVRWVEEDIALVADWMDDLRYDWLFLEEETVQDAMLEVAARHRVLDSASQTAVLKCGMAQLPIETIVLPSLTYLSRATWATLEEFASRGGRILCLGLLPRWSEIGRDEEQEIRLETQTRCLLEDVYVGYKREGAPISEEDALLPSSVGYPILRQTAAGGRIATYQPRLNLDRDDARLRVRPMLTESLDADLETQARDLRYTRRTEANSSLFWVWNTRDETLKANLVLRCGHTLNVEEANAWNATSTRLPIWMPLTDEEGGGLALTLEMAPHETRLIVVHTSNESALSAAAHGESANFSVESFDGEVARGIAKQSGAPTFAIRQNRKLIWWKSDEITVSSPILLDDWDVAPLTNERGETQIEYSNRVQVPAAWRDCRVRLEVASSSLGKAENVVEIWLNEHFAGRRFAPPLGFDLDLSSLESDENASEIEFALKLRLEPPHDDNWQPPLARLVAYPLVEVRKPS